MTISPLPDELRPLCKHLDGLYIEIDHNTTAHHRKGETLINNLKNGFYFVRTAESIEHGFNFGAGTLNDYSRYVENNKRYFKCFEL